MHCICVRDKMHFQFKKSKRLHENWNVRNLSEAKEYYIPVNCSERKHQSDWPLISNTWLLPKLVQIFSKLDGAVLVCGPPGSGKSLRSVYKLAIINIAFFNSMQCIAPKIILLIIKSSQRCASDLGMMYASLNLSSLSTANLSPLVGEKRGIFRSNSPQTLLELSEEREKINRLSNAMHWLDASSKSMHWVRIQCILKYLFSLNQVVSNARKSSRCRSILLGSISKLQSRVDQ